MKIICEKTNLLNGVKTVSKAVANKGSMSITDCILLNVTSDTITLTANNLELGIETIVEGTIIEKGIIALDAKMFLELVGKLPNNEVTISTDEEYKTIITCEKAKFKIIGKSGEDFSYLPKVEKNDSIIISQFSLREIIRQTNFSLADNDNSKIITGELFEIIDNQLKVVSSDGHRISIRKIGLRENYNQKKVIVPGKTLSEISKILLGDETKDVFMYFTPKHILFEFEKTIVVSRVIEGNYLKYDSMLLNDYETKVSINRKELLECIDRSTLLIKEGDKKPIIITITDGLMELKINSVVGSMNEEINIEKEGQDIMIGFNAKFIIDALKVIDDEIIELHLINPKAPCFIKCPNESYIYMIFPVNFVVVD